jgi:lysophospholipase L1-like esterase
LKKKIVCIGNSNVNGFPHNRKICWVSLLRGKLGCAVVNKGVNGDSAPGVSGRFESDVIAQEPDAAVILTGTNDFIAHGQSPESVMDHYREMAELALKNGIKPVFLVPVLTDPEKAAAAWFPDVDYEGVNAKLRKLRELMLAYGSEEPGVRVADLQSAYDCGFVDGIHFTAEGHEAVAELVAASLADLCPVAE